MRNTKGQAAMEFLMTYGWAILAAIIAIGVLSYFGVFSPGKYVSDTAVVNAPFYANSWKINTTGVAIEVKNNGGEDYTIFQYNVTNAKVGSTPTGCVNTTNVNVGIQAGAVLTLPVSCGGMTAGSNFKADIAVQYTKSGSSLPLTATGSIAGKIPA